MLLSYDADRRMAGDRQVMRANTPQARARVAERLRYALGPEGRPAGLSALALFWPHVTLAQAGDPLRAARAKGRRLSAAALEAAVASRLSDDAEAAAVTGVSPDVDDGPEAASASAAAAAHEAYFAWPGALPEPLADAGAEHMARAMDGDTPSEALLEHVRVTLGTPAARTIHPDLAVLAAHAPGNVAWRAVGTVVGSGAAAGAVTDAGLWDAAVRLADGLRSLFNRPDSIALLTTLYGDDRPYWRSVLDYCADGNLQAVLDEYLFQLHSETGGKNLDDDGLRALVGRAVEALGLRRATYTAHDPALGNTAVPLTARFALRYGGSRATTDDDAAGVRQASVREAFNSPFAPFVLASTSVGQEGIDFHWWSHAVVHWNLPGNPVDFEQREGRVNRFAGHAIRKNVAEAHWDEVVGSGAGAHSPWRIAFDAAVVAARTTQTRMGEFAPWWVYPGTARIQRVLASYPLSKDESRYEQLRSDLTLYRLTLGQPRQEDMVRLMTQRGAGGETVTIDLRPPNVSAPTGHA